MVEIGALRHRVEIGHYTEPRDSYGDPLPRAWQRVAEVWASVEALSGRLLFLARQTAEQTDHRIVLRYRPGLQAGMIARHGGREFEIQAVLDRDGRKRWLELLAREVKPA